MLEGFFSPIASLPVGGVSNLDCQPPCGRGFQPRLPASLWEGFPTPIASLPVGGVSNPDCLAQESRLKTSPTVCLLPLMPGEATTFIIRHLVRHSLDEGGSFSEGGRHLRHFRHFFQTHFRRFF